jgi:hypothetical protein
MVPVIDLQLPDKLPIFMVVTEFIKIVKECNMKTQDF